MIDINQLLIDLKKRKEKQKTDRAKFDEFAKVANTAASGVKDSYGVAVSAATIANTPIPANANIAGLVIQLIAAVPAIIETLNSDKPLSEKLTALLPLLVLPAIAAVAVTLTLAAMALAGAIVGLSLAGLIVGYAGYNLFKAYLAKEAIGTPFENKIDSIQGIYKYLISSEEDRAISFDPTARETFLAGVQSSLKDIDSILHYEVSLDKLQLALDKLAEFDQKVNDMTPKAINSRKEIAKEDQMLSSGVTLGFAIAGVVLAIIGVLALTIGAAPVVGTIVAAFSLVLMTVGLAQLATEMAFKRAENQKAEAVGDTKFKTLIQEALKPMAENQVTVAPVAPPSPAINLAPEIVSVPDLSPIAPAAPQSVPVPEVAPNSPEVKGIAVEESPAKPAPEKLPEWRKPPAAAPRSGPCNNPDAMFFKETLKALTDEGVEEKTSDSKRRTL